MANVTELDFDQIKADLKAYLSGQARFQDYNFDGSNLSVLLDILSYNTFQNNFYTNMAISEMFLDSAQNRDSVISHAKSLNYLPKSRNASRARINIALSVPLPQPNFVTIPEKTKFLAKCGNKTFNFYNLESAVITPVNGTFVYYGLDIFEGTPITETFLANGDLEQRFILSNPNIDTNTIKVTVKDSVSDLTSTTYSVRSNIFGVGPTDAIYYIQPYFDDQYEIAFGRNLFGKSPSNGNLITVEYMITNGELANGAINFAADDNIQNYNTTISTILSSRSGAEKETKESIQYFAPKALQVQDRAVTESDYEILLKNRFSDIQAVSVYGGEELDPPQYGRVAIAVDVKNANGLSENNRFQYYRYLKDRCPIGIEPVIISPKFMYLSVASIVYYNTKNSSASQATIKELVQNAMIQYSEDKLSDFKTTFRYSKFSNAIDNADVEILSNDTEVLAIIPLNPTLNVNTNFDLRFKNALKIDHPLTAGEIVAQHKPAIRSSAFVYNGVRAFIQDDGQGTLNILQTKSDGSFLILNANIGTVDYNIGRVNIKNLNISSYFGSEVKIFARTLGKDIVAPKDRILTIRESDINVSVVGVRA